MAPKSSLSLGSNIAEKNDRQEMILIVSEFGTTKRHLLSTGTNVLVEQAREASGKCSKITQM